MKDFHQNYIYQSTGVEKKRHKVKNQNNEENCKCFVPFVKVHHHDCPMAKNTCPLHGVPPEENKSKEKDQGGSEQCMTISFHPSSKTDRLLEPVKALLARSPEKKVSVQYYSPDEASTEKEPSKHRQIQTSFDDLKKGFANHFFVEKTKSFVADKTNRMKKLKQCFYSPCSSIIQRTRSQISVKEKNNEIFTEEVKKAKIPPVSIIKTPEEKLYRESGGLDDMNSEWFCCNKMDSSDWEKFSRDNLDSDFLTVTHPDKNNVINHKIFEINFKKNNDEALVCKPIKKYPYFVYTSADELQGKSSLLRKSHEGRSSNDRRFDSQGKLLKEKHHERKKASVGELSGSENSPSSETSGSFYYTPFILMPAGMDDSDTEGRLESLALVGKVEEGTQVEVEKSEAVGVTQTSVANFASEEPVFEVEEKRESTVDHETQTSPSLELSEPSQTSYYSTSEKKSYLELKHFPSPQSSIKPDGSTNPSITSYYEPKRKPSSDKREELDHQKREPDEVMAKQLVNYQPTNISPRRSKGSKQETETQTPGGSIRMTLLQSVPEEGVKPDEVVLMEQSAARYYDQQSNLSSPRSKGSKQDSGTQTPKGSIKTTSFSSLPKENERSIRPNEVVLMEESLARQQPQQSTLSSGEGNRKEAETQTPGALINPNEITLMEESVQTPLNISTFFPSGKRDNQQQTEIPTSGGSIKPDERILMEETFSRYYESPRKLEKGEESFKETQTQTSLGLSSSGEPSAKQTSGEKGKVPPSGVLRVSYKNPNRPDVDFKSVVLDIVRNARSSEVIAQRDQITQTTLSNQISNAGVYSEETQMMQERREFFKMTQTQGVSAKGIDSTHRVVERKKSGIKVVEIYNRTEEEHVRDPQNFRYKYSAQHDKNTYVRHTNELASQENETIVRDVRMEAVTQKISKSQHKMPSTKMTQTQSSSTDGVDSTHRVVDRRKSGMKVVEVYDRTEEEHPQNVRYKHSAPHDKNSYVRQTNEAIVRDVRMEPITQKISKSPKMTPTQSPRVAGVGSPHRVVDGKKSGMKVVEIYNRTEEEHVRDPQNVRYKYSAHQDKNSYVRQTNEWASQTNEEIVRDVRMEAITQKISKSQHETQSAKMVQTHGVRAKGIDSTRRVVDAKKSGAKVVEMYNRTEEDHLRNEQIARYKYSAHDQNSYVRQANEWTSQTNERILRDVRMDAVSQKISKSQHEIHSTKMTQTQSWSMDGVDSTHRAVDRRKSGMKVVEIYNRTEEEHARDPPNVRYKYSNHQDKNSYMRQTNEWASQANEKILRDVRLDGIAQKVSKSQHEIQSTKLIKASHDGNFTEEDSEMSEVKTYEETDFLYLNSSGPSNGTFVIKTGSLTESEQGAWGKSHSDTELYEARRKDFKKTEKQVKINDDSSKTLYSIFDSNVAENGSTTPDLTESFEKALNEIKATEISHKEEDNYSPVSDLSEVTKFIDKIFSRMEEEQYRFCDCHKSRSRGPMVDRDTMTDPVETTAKNEVLSKSVQTCFDLVVNETLEERFISVEQNLSSVKFRRSIHLDERENRESVVVCTFCAREINPMAVAGVATSTNSSPRPQEKPPIDTKTFKELVASKPLKPATKPNKIEATPRTVKPALPRPESSSRPMKLTPEKIRKNSLVKYSTPTPSPRKTVAFQNQPQIETTRKPVTRVRTTSEKGSQLAERQETSPRVITLKECPCHPGNPYAPANVHQTTSPTRPQICLCSESSSTAARPPKSDLRPSIPIRDHPGVSRDGPKTPSRSPTARPRNPNKGGGFVFPALVSPAQIINSFKMIKKLQNDPSSPDFKQKTKEENLKIKYGECEEINILELCQENFDEEPNEGRVSCEKRKTHEEAPCRRPSISQIPIMKREAMTPHLKTAKSEETTKEKYLPPTRKTLAVFPSKHLFTTKSLRQTGGEEENEKSLRRLFKCKVCKSLTYLKKANNQCPASYETPTENSSQVPFIYIPASSPQDIEQFLEECSQVSDTPKAVSEYSAEDNEDPEDLYIEPFPPEEKSSESSLSPASIIPDVDPLLSDFPDASSSFRAFWLDDDSEKRTVERKQKKPGNFHSRILQVLRKRSSTEVVNSKTKEEETEED